MQQEELGLMISGAVKEILKESGFFSASVVVFFNFPPVSACHESSEQANINVDDMPIERLTRLKPLTLDALRRRNPHRISTVGELTRMNEAEVMRIGYVSHSGLVGIRRSLAEFGLKLKGSKLWTGNELEDIGLDFSADRFYDRGISTVNALIKCSKEDIAKLISDRQFRTLRSRLRRMGHHVPHWR